MSCCNFLDLNYTKEEHEKNLIIYNELKQTILNKIIKEGLDNLNLDSYYNKISRLYNQIENSIENNVYDIEVFLLKIIKRSYDILDFNYFNDIFRRLYNIYDKKNWDYQNTEEYRIMYYSPFSFLCILGQKVRRIKSQTIGINYKVDENLEDTIYDLINYCMIYIIWLKKGAKTIGNINFTIKE